MSKCQLERPSSGASSIKCQSERPSSGAARHLLPKGRREKGGFTLIEILIALAVFAILATITSSAMYYAFNTRARVNGQADRLNSLQLAVTFLQRDIEQVVLREIRADPSRHFYPAFIGESQYVEFTRSGMVNPNSEEKRSILQRIAILCHNNQLLRRSWPSLDPADRKFYQDKVLVDNLLNCQFAYLNSNLQVLAEWRTNALQQSQHVEPEPLPKAIRINLTLKDWDKMSFLFSVPGALYTKELETLRSGS